MWLLVEKQADGRLEFFEALHTHLFPDQTKYQNALWLEESLLAHHPTHRHHSRPRSSSHRSSDIRPSPLKCLRRLI